MFRDRDRLNFLIDESHRLLIIRPIGSLSATAFVEELFLAYANVPAPWTYLRIFDFRRWDAGLDPNARAEISRRWTEATTGETYQAFVATVSADLPEPPRTPHSPPQFPQETVCHFTDYHEAIGWLLAPDRDAYLAELGDLPVRVRDQGQIRFE